MNNEEIEYTEENSTDLIKSQKEIIVPEETNQKLAALNKTIEDDFTYVRTNVKSVIDTAMEAKNNLARLAEQSEHPRIFEALNAVLLTAGQQNQMLLDIDAKMKDIIEGKEGYEPSEGGDKITNNAIFIGTTTELQQAVEDKIKKSLENGK